MSFRSNQNSPLELFPSPKSLHTTELPIPKLLPGVTAVSTATLKDILQDNHKKYHCYYNDQRFQNHINHTVIALWSLGADSDILKAAYAYHSQKQRPAFASPGPITRENWVDHLSDENYYDSYMSFFSEEIASKGPSEVLEEYLFSPQANFPEGTGKKVEMINRYLDGLVHPMIHTGYGLEFGLPGMIVEGLGQVATHPGNCSALIPAHWFQPGRAQKPKDSTSSALDILARVLADPEIVASLPPTDGSSIFGAATKKHSDKLVKHIDAWSPDISTAEGLKRTLEEVVYLIVLLYAVPGLTTKEEGLFNADFYTMHFVTSSIFLSSTLSHLKQESQEVFLRSYLVVMLAWFIARGKPQLDLKAFFENEAALKSLLQPATDDKEFGPSLPLPTTSRGSPNPWLEVAQRTLIDPNDHLAKIQRTLAHYAEAYGYHSAGYFKGSELKDADKIDGTLFVRAANLTTLRMIEFYKVLGSSSWDRQGYFQSLKERDQRGKLSITGST